MISDLERPEARDPPTRLATLEGLVDICAYSYAYDCLVKYVPQYAEAAIKAPPADAMRRRLLAQRAFYYIDYTTAGVGAREMKAAILDGEGWKRETTADAALYLRRQALAANVLLEADDYKGASDRVDRMLSLAAALQNPQDDVFYVAQALTEAMSVLLATGQTERAYGLYVASGAFVARSLPPLTADAVVFHLAEAQLLQETGRLEAAAKALDVAIDSLGRMEMEPGLADGLAGRAYTLKGAVCALRADGTCAQAALAAHPYAKRFGGDRRPATFDEVGYLAARALTAATAGSVDAAAGKALRSPVALDGGSVEATADLYRRAGLGLALPPGDARSRALRELGAAVVVSVEKEPASVFGAWRRIGAIDRLLVSLALAQEEAGPDAATTFALTQLAARTGPSFDADAFTLLAEAGSELQRRAIHQGLRLKARRDRLERDALRSLAARAASVQAGPRALAYDPGMRGVFVDFAARIAETEAALAADAIPTSGANLVPLRRFQSVLAPDEAALSVTPLAGDVVAYMCVRRGSVFRSVAKADLARAQIDARVIRAGLTAGHAPSDALDAQFPVEAAVRLYDLLVRPFDQCLKPGDRIVWLSSLSAFSLPLSALLERAPPKVGRGYDLAAADWLVKRHAVSYPGSASLVVAARNGRGGSGADFDFLGVGDPVMAAKGAGGVDLSGLAPLPETRAELEQSAAGFRSAKVLVETGATERAFRSQLVGAYRLLSFATHGLLREDLPGVTEPALVLTPGAGGSADDGLLTASEIADLNLAARFVALSACNTANYDLTQFSQDLPALASAFAVAGVPATLATLWPVESETSKRVVAGTFANLRADPGADPADAMAQAQRAFLAAPPGKAWLHPRFWAPFVLMGDGGTAPREASSSRLTAVEVLTHGGGEVLALEPVDGLIAARLIAEADGKGKHASAVRSGGDDGEAWRRTGRDAGASKPLLRVGGRLVAGGYRPTAGGVYIPVLESFDARTGAPLGVWNGDQATTAGAVPTSGARLSRDEALVTFLQVFRPQGAATGAEVHVFTVAATGDPKPLFTTRAPAGISLDEAVVAPAGEDVLLAYSARFGPRPREVFGSGDDFDRHVCAAPPVTWLERRDRRTGALKATRRLDGYLATSADSGRSGAVLLAGAAAGDCRTGRRAVVLEVDAELKTREIFRDRTLGVSEARALSVARGAVTIATAKENTLDYGRLAAAGDQGAVYSGMILRIAPSGEASPPRMLDSGGNLYVDGMARLPGGGMVVGGALGGEAALFRLSPP